MKQGYKVGDIKKLILKESSEFKAVMGPNVESEDKKNNEKSYKDAEKRAKDFDGGLKKETKGKLPEKEDYNRTTLDYSPLIEPDKEYKERIKAQAQGYTSKMEKDNKIEKNAQYDDDAKIFNGITKSNNKIKDEKKKLGHAGLVGRNMPETDKEKNTLYEKHKAKRLIFKYTKFLNEQNMLNKIPEEYKRDGQVIYMKDAADNEYVVECKKSKRLNIIETNVIRYSNKRMVNEQMNRIKELFNYNEKTDTKLSNQGRINEGKFFNKAMADSLNNKM